MYVALISKPEELQRRGLNAQISPEPDFSKIYLIFRKIKFFQELFRFYEVSDTNDRTVVDRHFISLHAFNVYDFTGT